MAQIKLDVDITPGQYFKALIALAAANEALRKALKLAWAACLCWFLIACSLAGFILYEGVR